MSDNKEPPKEENKNIKILGDIYEKFVLPTVKEFLPEAGEWIWKHLALILLTGSLGGFAYEKISYDHIKSVSDNASVVAKHDLEQAQRDLSDAKANISSLRANLDASQSTISNQQQLIGQLQDTVGQLQQSSIKLTDTINKIVSGQQGLGDLIDQSIDLTHLAQRQSK